MGCLAVTGLTLALLSVTASANVQLGEDNHGPTLSAFNSAVGDQYGCSVALRVTDNVVLAFGGWNAGSKGRAVVRSHNNNNNNGDDAWNDVGSYEEGGGWNGRFGFSVSLSANGTHLAVGAPSANYARMLEYDGSDWTQMGTDINEASGQFGSSVALSEDGTRLAVGAPSANYARVLEYDGSDWIRMGTDIAGEVSNQFGFSVALSEDGTRLAVGAPSANYVRVLEYDGSDWTQVGADIEGEVSGEDFGHSVALSKDGTIVAVGAPKHDINGTEENAGRILVLTLDDQSNWHTLYTVDGHAANELFGTSVAVSADGTIIAGGGPGEVNTAQKNGVVRVVHGVDCLNVTRGTALCVDSSDDVDGGNDGDDDESGDDDQSFAAAGESGDSSDGDSLVLYVGVGVGCAVVVGVVAAAAAYVVMSKGKEKRGRKDPETPSQASVRPTENIVD